MADGSEICLLGGKKGQNMLHEKSCGAIVYRKYHGNTEILLIKHINSGHWSFPKGHVEAGETEIETAMREIKEETAIDVIIDPTFRETVDFHPQEDEIAEVRWVDISYASNILSYENDKTIVTKAKTAIKEAL